MKHSSLVKFKIGLVVIILFTVVMLVLVLMQAGPTKQDNNTYNQASNVADTLNNYVESNSVIPSSLQEAGVNIVPSSVSYQKLSDSSYSFCVNYKTTSSGFDVSGVESDLITNSAGQNNSTNFNNSSNYYLYLDTSHHKGENCQTIMPFSNGNYPGPDLLQND